MAEQTIRLLDRNLGNRHSLPKNKRKIHRDTTATDLKDKRSPPKDDRETQIYAALSQLQDDVSNLENKLVQHKQANYQLQINEGVKQLDVQAEHINLLATHLEAAMFKFNQIARKVNRVYHAIQQPPDIKALQGDESRRHQWRPLNIWEVHHSAVPTVIRRCSQFLLTARQVDLLSPEHEDEVQRRVEAQNHQQSLEAWLAEKQGN